MRSAISDDDRTAKARIRDAAIARFAESGVTGTSLRAIAADADVSPGLVIHHFGSKDGLRVACDEHVAATIRDRKHDVMVSGPDWDPLAALRGYDGPPLLRYLARTLIDGSPHVAALVDEMVADAAGYMAEGVDSGALRPSAYPYGRAALLTMWSLGALVLHEHVERLLGVDLTRDLADIPDATAYLGPAIEMFIDGVVTPEMGTRLRDAFIEGDKAAYSASSRVGEATGS